MTTFENTSLAQETNTTCRYNGSVYINTNGEKVFVYTDAYTFSKSPIDPAPCDDERGGPSAA
jgi:hypothetical protein